jgi:Fe-S-cluster containining protein
VLDLGHCHHLRQETDERGRTSFQCGIYESRPAVCRTFNCVSWWRIQRANATGPTAGDAVIEKVAALRKEAAEEDLG